MNKKNPIRILIVQKTESHLEQLDDALNKKSVEVLTTLSVHYAISLIKHQNINIAIIDNNLQGPHTGSLLQYIYHNHDEVKIVVATESSDIPEIVAAVRSGAEDFMTFPLNREKFNQSIERLKQQIRIQNEMSQDDGASVDFHGLIGRSGSMKKMFRSIAKAANVRENVLITGESGTGKDLVARAIHKISGLPGKFMPVNCGALPPELLESELFGHEKGAYTGAHSNEQGFFQAADKGTIFLDEIGNTSSAMQAKLLRVLENTEIWKVGSRNPDTVDVRVIAATNVDLKEYVESGKFREDLFYRLNVIRLDIPPLRERTEDILVLVKHFTEKYAVEMDLQIPEFDDDVLQQFLNNPWVGNVRELQNTVKKLLMSEKKIIRLSDIPPDFNYNHSNAASKDRSLEEVELEHILRILEQTGWNKTKAADILGITRKTLLSKLKKNGIKQNA